MESFQRQIEALSATTRQALLVAAVDPVGDPVLVLRALDSLGIDLDAAICATEAASLVELDHRVRFRHPLLRSAIYRRATPAQRRNAHWALAQVMDPAVDPDRRAWHLAQAASGPDEEVAAELERRAGRARTRGGLAAAAAFLERASELTPDPARRGTRALAAAQAKHLAGSPDAALRLASVAEASGLGEYQCAEADLLRARIAFTVRRGRDTPALLLKAAARLEPLDVRLARDTYLDALRAAWYAADPDSGASLREVGTAARSAPAPASPPRPPDLLLDALAVRYTEGFSAAAPMLKKAIEAFRRPGLSGDEGLRWLWFASAASVDLCDDGSADALTSRFVRLARDSGALATLPLALTTRIVVAIYAGELSAAAALLAEMDTVAEVTEIPAQPYTAQLYAAWQGREAEVGELVTTTTAYAQRRGEGLGPINAGWARALLYNGLGRYEEALVAAGQATESRREMGILTWAPLVEFVTAATHAGRHDIGTEALARLADLTRPSNTDWARGMEACCRALLSAGERAEEAYLEAIDRLSRTRIRGHHARACLHYGEWLRRQNRRVDARAQLRIAHEMFTEMGMHAFAELAARELGATGEIVRRRSVETASALTAQETQIARLARDGLSNPEIASRLFISSRTVEWHLSKIFMKLQITSRRQLRD
jgi:DNA-binding CsgD family transcriptional regulator